MPLECRLLLNVILDHIYNSITFSTFVQNYFNQKMIQLKNTDYFNLSNTQKLMGLKTEINAVLNNNLINNNDKKEILIFLTVLKYSTSFWQN